MARFDELISEVEDLDPEPPPKGRAWLRELVLGMVLLVGVLGFAGWQWWRTEYLQQNYAAGRAALATYNWEQAAAHLSAASGYLDADDLIKMVREKAAERDRLYTAATHAMESQSYIGALENLQKLQSLQPGYKDTSAMRNAATIEVYREALSGTVAMRLNAKQPGLYYRSGDAWFYLVGSDKRSRMRSLDYGTS
jgi:hypothetical protein